MSSFMSLQKSQKPDNLTNFITQVQIQKHDINKCKRGCKSFKRLRRKIVSIVVSEEPGNGDLEQEGYNNLLISIVYISS